MIHLTKLDGKRILVGMETVKYIESIPDTLIHFLNGETVIVKEPLPDVLERVKEFKRELLHPAPSH